MTIEGIDQPEFSLYSQFFKHNKIDRLIFSKKKTEYSIDCCVWDESNLSFSTVSIIKFEVVVIAVINN